MKTLMLVLSLLVITPMAWPAKHQQNPYSEEDLRTHGLYNGRWWKLQPDGIKLGFVMGYDTHHVSFTGCSDAGSYFHSSVRFSEVITMIDDFYRDPANSAVSVGAAWTVAAMRFNGESAANIEAAMERFRQDAARPQ